MTQRKNRCSYKLYAEFEDENEVIEKYFIKELENYEEAIEFNKRTFDYLSVSWSFVREIGKPINDDSISFLYSSDFGMTNGFLSVYLVL
jgi:hypothetical protein